MIRVVTLCSGYDSQCLALNELKKRHCDFDYDLVAWSEIDKVAIKAHNALFPQWADRNKGDMTTIDWNSVPDFDMLFYSTPCQDFSKAGYGAGGEEGSGTRSSLLWYTRNAIVAKKPTYLIMENVDAIISTKHVAVFNRWLDELESYGYSNFYKVLNAKDYGVPQGRKRCFVVSILYPDRPFCFTHDPVAGNPLDVIMHGFVDGYQVDGLNNYLFSIGVDKDDLFDAMCMNNGCKNVDGWLVAPRLMKNGTYNTLACWSGTNMRGLVFGVDSPIPTMYLCKNGNITLRKISADERYRLMGVRDDDIKKLMSCGFTIPNHCFLSGNSIVVDVLIDILDKLLYGGISSLW